MFKSVDDVKKYVDDKVREHLNVGRVRVEYSNRMSTCLGRCKEQHISPYGVYHTLTFNLKYIKANYNNGDTVKNTILHEIAHAIAGGEHHHDSYWQQVCISIGGNGSRLESNKNIKHDKMYLYECPFCHRVVERPIKFKINRACHVCCDTYNNGKYSEHFKLKFIGTKTLDN